jgi:hypothetical protein
MKNKTLAAWLAFVGGPFGLQRFYLYGSADRLAWMLPAPTLIGLYGVYRARTLGLDDPLSWVLIPFLGFTMAGCAINALVYGLMATEKWNLRFNPGTAPDGVAGQTTWFTVGALALSLLVGTTVLMASLAFSFQHYFEYQAEAARAISQPADPKRSGD